MVSEKRITSIPQKKDFEDTIPYGHLIGIRQEVSIPKINYKARMYPK